MAKRAETCSRLMWYATAIIHWSLSQSQGDDVQERGPLREAYTSWGAQKRSLEEHIGVWGVMLMTPRGLSGKAPGMSPVRPKSVLPNPACWELVTGHDAG